MNIDKLFKRASEKGVTDIQVYLSDRTNLKVEIFNGEVDSYVIADTSSMIIRGIYNHKMGTFVTEVLDDEIIDQVIDTIIASAKEIDSLDDAIIYEGDKEYRKLDDIYNEALAKLGVEKKIERLKEMDKYLHEYDERISVVETMYSETTNHIVLKNSKGLDLENKANSAYMGGNVIVKDDVDQRVGFDVKISNNFDDFDIKEISKEIADTALDSLGAKPVPSNHYEIVFSNIALATLFSAFQNIFSADAVQKGASLLKGKLNEKIGSDLVTIVDDPFMKKSSSSRSFDDEGVATSYKALIKDGELKTYLHNLVTAKKDGVVSTGNGFGGSVSAVNLKMEPGNSSLDDMIASMEEGVYITSVQGAHAGANAVSGDFSLQALGYYVKNGKKDRPVALITVAGNFVDMLKDVTMVGNDAKMTYYGVTAPSVKIKSMPVSGS